MTPRALLEGMKAMRASVRSATPIERGPRHVVFRTSATVASYQPISSADSEMLARAGVAPPGAPVEGRLRLDAVSDRVIRVRYAEGTAAPDSATGIVMGAPPPPATCGVRDEPGALIMATAEALVRVTLEPLRIEVLDPAGTVVVGIGGAEKNHFCQWDAPNTGVLRDPGGSLPAAVESFDLRPGESIYGLGERFLKLDRVGQTLDLWTVDALGTSTPRAYKPVPFHWSTRGYGVLFNDTAGMTYWVGSRSACDVVVATASGALDYYVLLGSPKQILGLYADLTGRAELPPRWSFGYWQSKISYSAADEVLGVARELRQHRVPCDVIHLDTFWFERDWYCNLRFAPQRFPDPAGFMRELRELGFRVSLWQLPYIPEGTDLFEELAAAGGFVKDKDGGIYDVKVCFVKDFKGRTGVIDYTNPAAVRIHQSHLRRLLELGAAVFKTDFGEAAPADGVYHDGTPGHLMHNRYPIDYNRAVAEVTRQVTGRGFVWARSAWAGGQRLPVHWGGDNSPNWHNLAPQFAGGLSLGMSGFPFWSQDIGGFLGDTSDRLLTRWMQAGIFCSHARVHGFNKRELPRFSAETLRIGRETLGLRYRLLPYLIGQARMCCASGLPVLRALPIEWPDDPALRAISDQFLCGDSLLVAPVMDNGERRPVQLPAGRWTCWWTGGRYAGGTPIDAPAPLDRVPLFVREGGVVALGPELQHTDEKPCERIELLIAPFSGDGESRAIVDIDGTPVEVHHRRQGSSSEVRVGACPCAVDLRVLGPEPVRLTNRRLTQNEE